MRARMTVVSTLLCCAGLAATAPGALAAGPAVPVHRGTVYAAEVKAPVASEGAAYIKILFKTNKLGHVTQVVDEGVEKLPLTCTGKSGLLGTESFFEGEDVIASVAPHGSFAYKNRFYESSIFYSVAGKVLPGGRRATGTLLITPATELTRGIDEDCSVTATPMKWSVNLHWRKFGV